MSVSERFVEGEQAASTVLEYFGSDNPAKNNVVFPVDPVEIAGRMNILVQKANFGNQETASIVMKNETISELRIILSAKLDEDIMLAREISAVNIGRIFMNENETKFHFADTFENYLDDDFLYGFMETLLMPPFVVRKLYGSGKSLKKMCTYFGVTETAMCHRLENLALPSIS